MAGSLGGAKINGDLGAAFTGGGIRRVNGVPVSIDSIDSPMASVDGKTLRIDHGNVKVLTDAATVTGIDAALNQSFTVAITAARTIENPTNPRSGEMIIFEIEQDGGSFTPLWDTAYQFADVGAVEGVTQARADALAAATGDGSLYEIAFRYSAVLSKWICHALAGPFT